MTLPRLGLWIVTAGLGVLATSAGCATQTPLPPGVGIRTPLAPPGLAAPPMPAELPTMAIADDPPPEPHVVLRPVDAGPLDLGEVLARVETSFPLLYAIEQERVIASGRRLSAEGVFDPLLHAHGADQAGTFSNGRLNAGVQQVTPYGGISTFAGWRWGAGNFPVYNGGLKTGVGGEFRAGVDVPLLQNREIDPLRARLRAAQIAEQQATPVIRRARLDFVRAASQSYWAWQAAGAQYRVADDLARLANERQTLLDERLRLGLIGETEPVLNRRLAASRQEALLAAERGVQQAAVRLSLFLRDDGGNPVVPPGHWLRSDLENLEPPPPAPEGLAADVAQALARRPELVDLHLEKQQRMVDLQLAGNQLSPALNAYAHVNQDVGNAKKTFTGEGPFTTERTAAEVGATFEMPLQFRNAQGMQRTAQAQLAQLLAQERFTRDEITAEVQDAVSELVLAYERVHQARQELRFAQRVLELETEAYLGQQISLVELNLQEIAAAEARSKLFAMLGRYFAAIAEYQAALGVDNFSTETGAVLPQVAPGEPLPAP